VFVGFVSAGGHPSQDIPEKTSPCKGWRQEAAADRAILFRVAFGNDQLVTGTLYHASPLLHKD
jgi:hypothetical protein